MAYTLEDVMNKSELIEQLSIKRDISSKRAEDVVSLIQDSILYNCDSRIEMNDKAYFEPIGNNTEVALLKFL